MKAYTISLTLIIEAENEAEAIQELRKKAENADWDCFKIHSSTEIEENKKA